MRIDLRRFAQKQRGNLLRFARQFPAPVRRQLYYSRGLAAGPLSLPAPPWWVANTDTAAVETVTIFKGAFEPKREAKVYGAEPIVPRFVSQPRGPLRLRLFHDVVLLPHHVLLDQQYRSIQPVSFDLNIPNLWLMPARRPGHMNYNFEGDVRAPQQFDEPLFLADCPHQAFGHTLMEAIPKLPMLSAAPPDIMVATSARLFPALFEASGVSMGRVLPLKGPLFCKAVYVPDPPLDLSGNLHSMARTAFARLEALAAQSSIEPKPRLYLSRAKVPFRSLTNEGAVEALAARMGFEIIRPEDFSIPDQIKLMLNADMVMGPSGSNMHNLVYARGETKALLLSSKHWHVDIDAYIAKADWQFAHVIGTPLPRRPGQDERSRSWTIDIDVVEDAMRQHFGL